MTLPGFTAEASLQDTVAYYIQHGMPSASAQSLVRLATNTRNLSSVYPQVRYACHWVCDGNFCTRVCGPILLPDSGM